MAHIQNQAAQNEFFFHSWCITCNMLHLSNVTHTLYDNSFMTKDDNLACYDMLARCPLSQHPLVDSSTLLESDGFPEDGSACQSSESYFILSSIYRCRSVSLLSWHHKSPSFAFLVSWNRQIVFGAWNAHFQKQGQYLSEFSYHTVHLILSKSSNRKLICVKLQAHSFSSKNVFVFTSFA